MVRIGILLAVAAGIPFWFTAPAAGAADFPAQDRARIVIDQDRQQLLLYEGPALVRVFPISTGWPGKRETTTPAWRGTVGAFWGSFSSFGSTQDNGYWLFTDYLPDGRWNGDILIHGAPYQLDPAGAKRYETAQIGRVPVSHGCIQLLPEDSAWFRAWDPRGVAVEILPFTDAARVAPKLTLGAQLVGLEQAAPAPIGWPGPAGRLAAGGGN